jgi:putative PIN family toxin of toxin-antitoxin system
VRVVFDTNTVVSALLFREGRLSCLRDHWRSNDVTPLVSRRTADELIRVLAYPKFKLDKTDIEALLADYLPHTESVADISSPHSPLCRDKNDQMFVDLAIQGRADVLVTGDRALLEMELGVQIERPADFLHRDIQVKRS